MANKSKKAMTVKAEGNNGKEEQKKITAKPEPKKNNGFERTGENCCKRRTKKISSQTSGKN